MKNPLPTDIFGRSTRVFALAAGLAKHELAHQLKAGLSSSLEQLGSSELRTRVAQARLVAESLGRLKGAFMKAGQLLSLDASDFLPPEALEILSKLQGQATPVDYSVMASVLASELGPEVAQLTELDPRPAASASIGQVHRARAFGELVAVKIQYPGVAESIDADIAVLEKLSSSWLALTRREIDLSDTFAELRAILHLEADYERERRHQQRFAALLASDPRFAVPRAVAARDGDYAMRSRVVVREFVGSLQFSSPPRRLIFLHRKLGGIFQLLKRLDLELDLSRYWEQMVAAAVGFEAQRTPHDLDRFSHLT